MARTSMVYDSRTKGFLHFEQLGKVPVVYTIYYFLTIKIVVSCTIYIFWSNIYSEICLNAFGERFICSMCICKDNISDLK